MPSRKPTKKKSSHRKKLLKSLQRGKIFGAPLMIVVAVLVLLVGAAILFKPWQYFSGPFKVAQIKVIKPTPDFSRARQMTIDPARNTVMQIKTKEKVVITLTVPEGSLDKKTNVKLIPYYYNNKSQSPTAGVIVSPASINFKKPVMLSFNLNESPFRNDAPKNLKGTVIRSTGLSQVLQIDSKASTYTPVLIARSIETATYLPARILTGGGYVFSFDGKNQVDIAKKAIDAKSNNSLIVMESATSILFNNTNLTNEELRKAKSAVSKILSKKQPPAFEYYAALILQKKIKNPKFTLVPKAYAYTTDEGYFQYVCRVDTFSVEEYMGFAKTAQLLGQDQIGESCINKAKNKVAEETKKLLATGADIKTLVIQLQDIQLLGLDDETNLDEQLQEKIKETAVQDAKKVADDPNSTVIDAAKQLQIMEAVGVESGPTHDALSETVKNSTEKYDEPKEDPFDEEASIDEEEILYSQAMSVLGVEMLKAFGFEDLDKESLKAKFDEMQEQTKSIVDDFYPWCVEAGGEDCGATDTELRGLLKEAEEQSYRAEEMIGNAQSQEYETPDYTENNGDYELYFEVDLTPTPEEGSDVENSDDQSEEVESEDPAYNEQGVTNYDDSADDQGDQPESQEESEQSSGE